MYAAQRQLNDDPLAPYIGMVIALGAWSMLFATLFFIYFVIRVQASGWYSYDSGDKAYWLALMNTAIILASSVSYFLGSRTFKSEQRVKVCRYVTMTIGLGVAFLFLQFGLWWILEGEGFTVRAGHAAALYYVLSGFHAVHIMGGLVALLWVFAKIKRSDYCIANVIPIDLVGYFWHFLTVVWILMFVVIFVIR